MPGFLIELFLRGLALCLLTGLALGLLRRSAAAHRHLVCVLALLGLLFLPLAQRLLPPLRLLPPQQPALPQRAALPAQEMGSLPILPEKPEPPPYQDRSRAPILKTRPPAPIAAGSGTGPQSTAPRNPAPYPETAVLLAIWGLGVATLLLRLLVALFRLHRLEAGSRQAVLDGVPIRISDQIQTPLTWGIRRSILLLPAALLSADRAVCESALRHEQAHIARWDWMWNLLAEVVCAFCWFQPGVWWLRWRMRLESERACDDRVLLSGIAGPDYAAHLLEVVRFVGPHSVAPAMAQGGEMEERMRHILDGAKPRQASTTWLAISAVSALTLLSLATLRVSARPQAAQLPTDRKATTMDPKRSVSPPPSSEDPTAKPATVERASAPQPPPASPATAGQANASPPAAPVAQEPANIVWGSGREVQAGLAMVNRYGRDDQHTGLYVFGVYLRNRTNHTLNVNCPSFDGLTVPGDDTDYTTLIQSPHIYCTPHLRDSTGRSVDVNFQLGAEESPFSIEPGQVVLVSHWMLRTMASQTKDVHNAKYTLVAFVAPGKHRMACDVNATWGGRRTTLHTGEAAIDVTGEDVGITAAKPDAADGGNAPQGNVSPAVPLEKVAWGQAVDGLQPGFLLTTAGLAENPRVPWNSHVDYQVLVRNVTAGDLYIEFRRGNSNPWQTIPYLIPNADLRDALRAQTLPERFRAIGVTELSTWVAGYQMKLGPGETVVEPDIPGLYIGDANKESFPRIEAVQKGNNWIVQPVTVHRLTAAEKNEYEMMSKTPFSTKKMVTVIDRDGKTGQRSVPQVGASPGGKQLYPRIQIQVEPHDAGA